MKLICIFIILMISNLFASLPEIWRSDNFQGKNKDKSFNCNYGLFVFKEIDEHNIIFQRVHKECIDDESEFFGTSFLDIEFHLTNGKLYYNEQEVGSYSNNHFEFDGVFLNKTRVTFNIQEIDAKIYKFLFIIESVYSLSDNIRPVGNLFH